MFSLEPPPPPLESDFRQLNSFFFAISFRKNLANKWALIFYEWSIQSSAQYRNLLPFKHEHWITRFIHQGLVCVGGLLCVFQSGWTNPARFETHVGAFYDYYCTETERKREEEEMESAACLLSAEDQE